VRRVRSTEVREAEVVAWARLSERKPDSFDQSSQALPDFFFLYFTFFIPSSQ
jgi:hypothetical protein